MSSLTTTSSWVIVNKQTRKAVFETFCFEFADTINKEKYQAIPILEYLQGFNASIKNNQ